MTDTTATSSQPTDDLHALIAQCNSPEAEWVTAQGRIRSALVILNKAAILKAMSGAGVARVVVEYAGAGDSGEGIDVGIEPAGASATVHLQVVNSSFDQDGKRWVYGADIKELPLDEAAEQLCEDLISEAGHSGYENGDGGGGTMTLTLETGELQLEHYDCYIERDTSHHTF